MQAPVGAGSGKRVFILASGDNPYAICLREFGDGMLYLRMEYNGQRLTEQSACTLPDGARLVYRPNGGGHGQMAAVTAPAVRAEGRVMVLGLCVWLRR